MSCEEKIAAMKQRVFEANLALPQYGLVKLTWGNVSEVDRELGVIVVKPSGVRYERMQADQMVVTDLSGNIIEEDSLKPSSDLPTHVVLYKAFEDVTAVILILILLTLSCGRKQAEICQLMARPMLMLFMVRFLVHAN